MDFGLSSVVMFSVNDRAFASGEEELIAQGAALYNRNCSKQDIQAFSSQ